MKNQVGTGLCFWVALVVAVAAAPPPELRVAVAQSLVHVGEVARNVTNMEPLVAEAARRGAGNSPGRPG